jgi:hypothetical protein
MSSHLSDMKTSEGTKSPARTPADYDEDEDEHYIFNPGKASTTTNFAKNNPNFSGAVVLPPGFQLGSLASKTPADDTPASPSSVSINANNRRASIKMTLSSEELNEIAEMKKMSTALPSDTLTPASPVSQTVSSAHHHSRVRFATDDSNEDDNVDKFNSHRDNDDAVVISPNSSVMMNRFSWFTDTLFGNGKNKNENDDKGRSFSQSATSNIDDISPQGRRS